MDSFCRSIAQAHESVSVFVAHGIKKISVKEGHEFNKIIIFGDDKDEFLTILVNAIGLRSPPPETYRGFFEFKTVKPSPSCDGNVEQTIGDLNR